jgi:hypothetical protein
MNPYKKNKIIVFTQWSRKNYAIFASLGKLIKIGQVSADICKLALKKTSAGSILITDIKTSYKSIPKDSDRFRRWMERLQSTGINLQTLIYLFLMITNTTCKVEYSSVRMYAQLKSMFCNTQGMDFLFIYHGKNHL